MCWWLMMFNDGYIMVNNGLYTSRWLSHASEKYELVSWDYCSQYMET